jgi:mono/diheme cytochrome c family protein
MKTIRRVFKWALRVFGVLLILAGAFALYVQLRGIPKYPVQHVELKVESTPERVARGKQFAALLCVNCHRDAATGLLTGKEMKDAPGQFGEIRSRNITRHPTRGIGSWTDGELAVLFRTGIRRDGQYLPPYMVKLSHLSDEDLFSIIAFLRSDDPLVAPSETQLPPTRPSFLTKLLSNVAFKPLPYPTAPIEAPSRADKVAYGQYLVEGLDCFPCHSADFKTMNVAEPEKTPGYLGGGNEVLDLSGKRVYSANITFDEETGIGKWSEAEFTRALRHGFRPDNSTIRYPMVPMTELSDEDSGAIYAYLKTVPKLKNPRKAADGYALASGDPEGKKIYYKYACYSCHGEQGVGIADLRHNRRNYPTDDGLRAWIRNAPNLKPDTKMPTWDGVIADNEYAPLIQYVRALCVD